MTNSSGRIRSYRFQEEYEAFIALARTLEMHGSTYYLIGGQARDLLLYEQNRYPPSVTPDIDFAVMVEDLMGWKTLIEDLVAAGFIRTRLEYRLQWPGTRTEIDLLPFGGIAEGDILSFPGANFEISVAGFVEVSQQLHRISLVEDGSLSIPIAPFHGIFLLKLISWSDRPEHRHKDLGDLRLILWSYWDFVEMEVFDYHLDIFELGIPENEWGSRVLGRNIGTLLRSSPALLRRIRSLLDGAVNDPTHKHPLLLGLVRHTLDGEDTIEDVQGQLAQALNGISDSVSD